jgi:hypothetical protein
VKTDPLFTVLSQLAPVLVADGIGTVLNELSVCFGKTSKLRFDSS